MSTIRFSALAGSAIVAAFALSACESVMTGSAPKSHELSAAATPAKEVPAKSGNGQSFAFVNYNEGTRALTWKVYYTGLSGPATAAHFHGPADKNGNAGVALNLVASGAPASPITGSATLTPAQAADLLAGKWYVNIHTQANPSGEVRGQVGMDAW
ncbi:MAG: CHRD domain-containing protein [Proteobacteria bacterium]|nr:CHRD domain-containing protein [Pseudomonadota bacterium]